MKSYSSHSVFATLLLLSILLSLALAEGGCYPVRCPDGYSNCCSTSIKKLSFKEVSKYVNSAFPNNTLPETFDPHFIPKDIKVEMTPSTKKITAPYADKLAEIMPNSTQVLYRRILLNEETYPWSTIGRVCYGHVSNFNETAWRSCGSATLVGRNVIVTAGHVVPWDIPPGQWWMRFTPAYRRVSATDIRKPFGESFVEECYGYDYGEDNVTGKDYAVCKLLTPLGDTVGYMGAHSSTGDSFYYSHTWTSVGYPVESNEQMTVEDNVRIDDVDDQESDGKEIESYKYSTNGWSGGPLWADFNGGPRVVGVVSGNEQEFSFWDFFRAWHTVHAGGKAMTNLIRYGRNNW